MKKLILLTLLLLLSFKSFSQGGTIVSSNDTIIPLKLPVVRLVISDLLTGDGAKLELLSTIELLKLEQKKVVLKDSVIGNLNTKVLNLNSILTKKDEQFGLEAEKSKQLLKELKSEKRKSFFYKMGTYVGGIALGILLIQK